MKALLLLLMIAFTLPVWAQHVADTFQSAETKGYSMLQLDKQYPSAIGAGEVVFKGDDQQKLTVAYGKLIQDLAKYLNQNNFYWKTPVRIFNRIYFEPDGSISYYLVNLAPTDLDEARQQQFLTLLNKFVQNYKINITAKSRFAQCSPVLYSNIL